MRLKQAANAILNIYYVELIAELTLIYKHEFSSKYRK